jgi:hypothetical protein
METKRVKIIQRSNFDDESVSDNLIAENVSEHFAIKAVNLLNEMEGPTMMLYAVVDSNYKLYQFEP